MQFAQRPLTMSGPQNPPTIPGQIPLPQDATIVPLMNHSIAPNHPIPAQNYCPPANAQRGRPERRREKTIRCFKCGCFGHDGKTCTKNSANGDEGSGEEKCWVCGCLGHHAKNCKSKEVTCFSCGEKGHKQANCKSKMANCWNCGQSGHIKRDCKIKTNVGMCFSCFGTGHHANACPNRKCHHCQQKGHLKNDCPLLNGERGHMTDSEIQGNPRHRQHNHHQYGSHSADEFASSNPRSRGNTPYGFIMPPTPNQPQAGPQQYGQYPQQYGQQYGQTIWGQQGMQYPSTPTGYYQQTAMQWQQPQAAYHAAQQQLPPATVLTGRRVSRPVFDDSQSESSYTADMRHTQLSMNRRVHNDLMSISGSTAASDAGADDERTEDELPSAVPRTLRMNTARIGSVLPLDHKFSPSAKEFKPRKLSSRSLSRQMPTLNGTRLQNSLTKRVSRLSTTRTSEPVLPEILNGTSAPVDRKPEPERAIGDRVFAKLNKKTWFGTILRSSKDTVDIEVELKNGTKKTLPQVSKCHLVSQNSFDNIPSEINEMQMTPSSREHLKKRALEFPAERDSDCNSDGEEDDILPDTMGLQLPNFDDLPDDDGEIPYQDTPKDQPREEEKFEEEVDDVIFTFDEEEYKKYDSKTPPLGGLVREITLESMGETWQQVCRRSVEWVFETQRRHCLKNGIKWDKSKSRRRSIELFSCMFKMQVLPSFKFLRYARRSQDYDQVAALSFFDTGFVSTQVTEKTLANPGRAFGFFISCRLNAVNISYDTRICEGAKGQKYIVEAPRERDVPEMVTTPKDLIEALPKFLEKLVNSYLIRGHKRPDVLARGEAQNYYFYVQKINTICKQIFERQLGLEIQEATVISIMEALVRIIGESGTSSSSAVIRNEAKIQEQSQAGSQPDFSKSSRLIALKAESNIKWDELLNREFKKRKSDEVSIIFTDNMKKVLRFTDPERQSIRNLNVQGQNPGCDMTLESYELAPKVEIVLPSCGHQDEFLYACKYAVLIAKTINLLEIPSWPITTSKLKNNSRTGIGLFGITTFLAKHTNDYALLKSTCKKGYDLISARNKNFAQEFKTAESITKTSVNFQSDLTLLTGVPPGMVYFFSRYCLRHVPIRADQVPTYTSQGLECITKITNTDEFKFGPGTPGFDVDSNGTIRSVQQASQASVLGIQPEWKLTEVNRKPFSEDTLRQTILRANDTNGAYVLKFRSPFGREQHLVKIPVDAGPDCNRSCFDVPCAEQLQLCVFLNEVWSDNAVNAPIPFNESTEFALLPMLLRTNQFKLKSVKFWRHDGHPTKDQEETHTTLTKEEFNAYIQERPPQDSPLDVLPSEQFPALKHQRVTG